MIWVSVSDRLPCQPGVESNLLLVRFKEFGSSVGYALARCWISVDHPHLPKFYLDRDSYNLHNLLEIAQPVTHYSEIIDPMTLMVETRPCGECQFFKVVSSPPPICRKNLMAVTAEMHVTYHLADGSCFEIKEPPHL